MNNLIKMEWYKLRTTKMFYVLLGVVFGINVLLNAVIPVLFRLIAPDQALSLSKISDMISSPMSIGLLMLCVFMSAVSFLYSDFTGGYIKNIAGQVKRRGNIAIAKFVVVGIHNLIFFVVGSASCVLGAALGGRLSLEGNIGSALLTLLLKWLLSMAIASIFLFITVGLNSKTFAVIAAVIFAVNALSLAYLGINTAVATVFKWQNFSFGDYMPDALMGSVNVETGSLVVNALIVSAVFIVGFLLLTVKTFESRDVK